MFYLQKHAYAQPIKSTTLALIRQNTLGYGRKPLAPSERPNRREKAELDQSV